jgi:hypothetical protein
MHEPVYEENIVPRSFIVMMSELINDPKNFDIDRIIASNNQDEFDNSFVRSSATQESTSTNIPAVAQNTGIQNNLINFAGTPVQNPNGRLNISVGDLFASFGRPINSNDAFEILLKSLDKNSFEHKATSFFYRAAKKMKLNIPVVMEDLRKEVTGMNDDADGTYYGDRIAISKYHSKSSVNTTILHELVHAVFQGVEDTPEFSKQLHKYFMYTWSELSEKYGDNEHFKKGDNEFYGVSLDDAGRPNYKEFIAELFSNARFREMVQSIRKPGVSFLQDLFERLLIFIGDVLHIKSFVTYGSKRSFFNEVASFLVDNLKKYDGVYSLNQSSGNVTTTGTPKKSPTTSSELSDFDNVFTQQNQNIEFIPDGHLYINNKTGENYTSVSKVDWVNEI